LAPQGRFTGLSQISGENIAGGDKGIMSYGAFAVALQFFLQAEQLALKADVYIANSSL